MRPAAGPFDDLLEEAPVIALLLDGANHWTGNGKWLLRELRDLDPTTAERWLAAAGDAAAIEAFGTETLDRFGGPLFDGYRATAPRPPRVG